MAQLVPLTRSFYRQVYDAAMVSEPYRSKMTYTDYITSVLEKAEGFVVCDGPNVIGHILYLDFAPGIDIVMHNAILPTHHGRWVTRTVLREAFSFPFVTLGLGRVSSFYIPGYSDVAGHWQRRLGFKEEGVKRRCAMVEGKLCDIVLVGMLREECKWV